MYHIVWGAVIGLVVYLIAWYCFKLPWKKYLIIGVAVIIVAIGALLGNARHTAVCNNLSVVSITQTDRLRGFDGRYGDDSSAPVLEKMLTDSQGLSAYIYWSNGGFSMKTVLDNQNEVRVVYDGLYEVEVVEFRPSSKHCEKNDQLVLPKNIYIFHVPEDRYIVVDGN